MGKLGEQEPTIDNQDIITFDTSQGELEDIIYALKQVNGKIDTDDRLKVSIDFNKGTIKVYVKPRGDYEFVLEY